MSAVIGLDHGSRRIGVAVGDDGDRAGLRASGAAAPQRGRRPRADRRRWHGPRARAGSWSGLPRNMDGSEGPQAAAARAFGAQLSRDRPRGRLRRRAAHQLAGGGAAGGGGAPAGPGDRGRRTRRRPASSCKNGSTAGDPMTRTPDPRWDKNEQRNARIRELRDQRDAPIRRRRTFQPLTIAAWFAAVIALARRSHLRRPARASRRACSPGSRSIPARSSTGSCATSCSGTSPTPWPTCRPGRTGQRITVEVVAGANDAEIGQLLFDKGVITSQLAFQYAVLQAGRSGDLQAGVYDLSPSLRPSRDRGRAEAGGRRGGHRSGSSRDGASSRSSATWAPPS